MSIDRYEALGKICEKLGGMTSGNTMSEAQVRQFAALALDLDLAYMQKAGVFDGEEYDDNAAFEYILRGLARHDVDEGFIEDYMEAMEAYLEESGAIAWDGE